MAHILKSEYEDIAPPNEKTLPEYFLARAKTFAEEGRDYWLVDGLTDEKHYFSMFNEETAKIASAFWKLGLRKGDTVVYMIRDLSKISLLLAGVWRANGIMRASYPDDDEETILFRVNESKCKFIVCEEDGIPVCRKVAVKTDWEMHVITVKKTPICELSLHKFLDEDDGAAVPDLQVTENDFALILCTSGTTGMPKGAVHTHKGLLYQIRSFERVAFTIAKPNLVATKATHISGTTTGLIALASGKSLIVVSDLTRENIFNAAAKYKPGVAFAFPTILVAMAGPEAEGYDFSSIEVILCGGVPITPALKETFMKLPNVKDTILAYGLTEILTCTNSGILRDDGDRGNPSMRDLPDFSVGKPYPGVELQIRDPQTQQTLGPNQRGEICVKSPGMFHSYFMNPEATEEAFVNGFFKTGDIGYYDEKGFVYLVDRLKEIFKYYNDHISPTELENVLGQHAKVREVCVVGVPDVGGHVPRAFVEVHSNCGNKVELEEKIKEFANLKLAPYKHLRGGVYIVDELPKGKTGKVTRQLVAKLSVA